ncbi:MAG: hypothetical protein WCY89_04480 [Flavobacteriaceae bacterium]
MKHYLTLLFVLVTFTTYCQNNRTIHQVHIQIDKRSAGGETTQKYIGIDSKGFISISGKKTTNKINLLTFTNGIQNLIIGEKIEKTPAHNNAIGIWEVPRRNKKFVFIHIIFSDDFNTDKDFIFKSSYELTETDLDINQTDYNFFKYFEKEDIDVISKALE